MSKSEQQPLLGNVQQYGAGAFAGAGAKTCGVPRNLANVLTMSFAYLCLFSAFQTTQALASAVLGRLGNLASAVLYCTFVGGGFVAPVIVRYLGPVRGLVFGACTYVLFVASFIYIISPVVVALGALLGFGAAVLWCSQGMIITQNTNETNKTTYSSLFWGIFNLNLIPGLVTSHFLLHDKQGFNGLVGSDSGSGSGGPSPPPPPWYSFPLVEGETSYTGLMICLFVMGVVGIFLFLLIRPPDRSQGSPPEKPDPRPVCSQVWSTFALVFRPRMIALLPMFLFTGVELNMWLNWFPRQMHNTEIGLVMPAIAVAELIGGLVMGKLTDMCGRWFILLPASLLMAGALWMTWEGNNDIIKSCVTVPCIDSTKEHPHYGCACKDANYHKFYIAAVMYGFADCGFQSITSAVCATDFVAEGLSADAFALFRSFQSLGVAAGFWIAIFLGVSNGAGGLTADPQQLQLELEITAGSGLAALLGFAVYSMTEPTKSPPTGFKEIN